MRSRFGALISTLLTMRLILQDLYYKMYTIYTVRLILYNYLLYILQDLYYIYYKTYTMKLMLHIYYDVHVYDKTNIYTFRHTVHYIYYKTYTMRLILYILSLTMRIILQDLYYIYYI